MAVIRAALKLKLLLMMALLLDEMMLYCCSCLSSLSVDSGAVIRPLKVLKLLLIIKFELFIIVLLAVEEVI